MAEWGVFYRRVEVFPHDNADSLEVVRAGNYQFVVRKGTYQTDDMALVIPEKAVLTGRVKEEYQDYLAGSNKDRVKSVKLRGELSMGILLSVSMAEEIFGLKEFTEDVDYSDILGIIKYEPPVPTALVGKVYPMIEGSFSKHDAEHLSVYRDALEPDEEVVITEKIHGSQIAIGLTEEGEFFVTSKGLFGRGFKLQEEEGNAYWRAVRILGMEDRLRLIQKETGGTIQVFGELAPVQGGWTYGKAELDIIVFDVHVNGRSLSFPEEIPAVVMELWAPILYVGTLSKVDLQEICRGNEQVSGRELHIREGAIVRPLTMRYAKDGTRLHLKVINPAYSKKETGEEIS